MIYMIYAASLHDLQIYTVRRDLHLVIEAVQCTCNNAPVVLDFVISLNSIERVYSIINFMTVCGAKITWDRKLL